MRTNNNAQSALLTNNLLNTEALRSFLKLQTEYGTAQRGGSSIYLHNNKHLKRIASEVNFLNAGEIKQVVFENFISKN